MSSTERDRAIERMLRPTLRAGQTAETTGACLDAESLAALLEGELPADQVASFEEHTATCTRCQAMLAAMARTAPPPTTSVRSWRSFLIPAAVPLAAAAVFAIAISVILTRGEPPPVQEERQAAAPPSAHDHELPDTPSSQFALESQAELSRREQLPRNQPLPQKKEEMLSGETSRDMVPSSSAVATGRASAVEAPAAPPAVAQARPPDVAETAPAAAESITVLSDSASGTIEISSANPLRRWRLGPGAIERSLDGGVTWERQYFDPTAVLTAASAASAEVAWVVGRAGLVLLSTDGATWRRVTFPHRVDLTAVRATDGASATVIAVDGRSFVTTNAGLTWDPSPLQEFPAAPF